MEMQALLKEAKENFLPTTFPEEDAKRLFKTKEELDKDKNLIETRPKGAEVLDNADINLEILRRVEDKHYDVDIEYEQ